MLNSVIRSNSITSSQVSVMSDQWRMSLHMTMHHVAMLSSGEGNFTLFDKIPVSTVELPILDVPFNIFARKAYKKVAFPSE